VVHDKEQENLDSLIERTPKAALHLFNKPSRPSFINVTAGKEVLYAREVVLCVFKITFKIAPNHHILFLSCFMCLQPTGSKIQQQKRMEC